MPVHVACLVPSAPLLLPRLTGERVDEETADVRAAVEEALRALVGLDSLVVVAPAVPGTLDGFGGRPAAATVTSSAPTGSWPHALAAELLAGVPGAPPVRGWASWDERWTASVPEPSDGRTGLLLLADGSRTRGPRAPGGDDPRGETVDTELEAALREGREALVPHAASVGATAGPAVALLARLGLRARHEGCAPVTDVLLAGAPLGVGYLVAVHHRDRA